MNQYIEISDSELTDYESHDIDHYLKMIDPVSAACPLSVPATPVEMNTTGQGAPYGC